MERFIVYDKLDEAVKALDDAGVKNDLDGGNRIMVSNCDVDYAAMIFTDNDIDFDYL